MCDEKFILSEGRAKLLSIISESGSITRAAKEMNMSYRYAWGVVREIEKAVGQDVVISERGGKKGGGTRLTEKGEELLITFEELKKEHKKNVYKKPSLTVDGVIFQEGKILLIKRRNPPFKRMFALPGVFVKYGESVEDAVKREIKEETGLKTEIERLIGVYSDPDRDPRGHTISTVFYLKLKGGELESGSDAEDVAFFSVKDLPKLAFDHFKIVEDFLSMVR